MGNQNHTPIQTTIEEWRDIPGYEDAYQVSDLGNVRRKIALGSGGRYPAYGLLTPRVHRQGYLEIVLCYGRKKAILAHRLVMFAFVGLPSDGLQVNHKNGIKADNRLCNLEYVTARQNTRHAICELGREGPKGEINANSKLVVFDVVSIRTARANGKSVRDIANEYGLSRTHVYDILKRKAWKHVA